MQWCELHSSEWPPISKGENVSLFCHKRWSYSWEQCVWCSVWSMSSCSSPMSWCIIIVEMLHSLHDLPKNLWASVMHSILQTISWSLASIPSSISDLYASFVSFDSLPMQSLEIGVAKDFVPLACIPQVALWPWPQWEVTWIQGVKVCKVFALTLKKFGQEAFL